MRRAALVSLVTVVIGGLCGCGPTVGTVDAGIFHGAWEIESSGPTFNLVLDNARITSVNGQSYTHANAMIQGATSESIIVQFCDYVFVGDWHEAYQSYIGELTYKGQLVDDSARFYKSP